MPCVYEQLLFVPLYIKFHFFIGIHQQKNKRSYFFFSKAYYLPIEGEATSPTQKN